MPLFNAPKVNKEPPVVSRRTLPKKKITMPAYPSIDLEQFAESERDIASLIYRRRLQILVHSCIYYQFDKSLITDAKFDSWGHELAQLQQKYPSISKRLCYADVFEGWSGGSGAFLPYRDPWVYRKAEQLITYQEETYGTTQF